MAKQFLLISGRSIGDQEIVKPIKPGLDTATVISKLEANGFKVRKCKSPPSTKTMEKWVSEGMGKATDGCRVECDGTCAHGHKSWLLQMGLI